MISTVRYPARYGRAEEETAIPGAASTRRMAWGPVSAVVIALAWAAGVVVSFQVSLMILTILGFAALVAGLRYPAIGLLGLTVLCILDAPARVYILTGGLLRWNTLNYWLLLIMALYLPFLLRLRDPHSLTLAAFIGLLTLEILISPDIGNGMQNVLGILAVFGMLIYFVRAGHDGRMWFWLSFNGGLVGALGGLVFFLERMKLPQINANAWAAFPLTALIAVVLGFPDAARMRNGQTRLLMLASVNMVWIFLSGSRGTLLIGGCCFLVLIIALRGMRQRTISLMAAAVIALVAAAHFSELQERTIHRLVKLFTTEHAIAGDYTLAGRTSGRSDLAIGGWYIFQNHPLGVGTGGFADSWSELGKHYGLVYRRGEKAPAHSGWVKTMVENGIPGLVLLMAYVSSFALVAMRQRNWDLWRLGMMTSVAIAAGLLSTEFQTKGLWLLAAGAMTFLQRARMDEAMYSSPVVSSEPPTRRNPWSSRYGSG
jgi:hypothetical protein